MMCQEKCLKLLKKERIWLSTREISKKLKLRSQSLPLKKLFLQGEINRRVVKEEGFNPVIEWKVKE